MRIIVRAFALVILLAFQLEDQIWIMDKEGSATFSTTLENGEKVEGKCERLGSIFRLTEKNINISIPLSGFVFEKSGLIDQFTSADYMNAKASPSIVFNGSIPKAEQGKFDKEKKYNIEGELVVGGKPAQIIEEINLVEKDGQLWGSVTFSVNLNNHGIKIDDLMKAQFGEKFTLTCHLNYKLLDFAPKPKN